MKHAVLLESKEESTTKRCKLDSLGTALFEIPLGFFPLSIDSFDTTIFPSYVILAEPGSIIRAATALDSFDDQPSPDKNTR